jgi:acetylornithine deacetylase
MFDAEWREHGHLDRAVALIERWCRSRPIEGLRLDVVRLEGRTPVILAEIPGSSDETVLLYGHCDKQPEMTGWAEGLGPWTTVLRGDRLYGRGASDMKAGLAAMVGAVAAVLAAGGRPRGDVLLTFAVDEEDASIGTAAIAGTHRADAAIVTEPTGLRICVAHKGFVWATIRAEGRAAHGSDYDAGIDAILHMGRVLGALEELDREVLGRRSHPLLGRPSIHASFISGGEGPSTYPPSCTLVLERRTLPGETTEDARAELEAVLARLREGDPSFRATLAVTLARPGLEVDRGADIVRALHAAAERCTRQAPAYVGMSPWFDAALLADAGIPTVIFGPSGAGWHGDEEYVDVLSMASCAEILAETIMAFCNTRPA